MAKEQNSKCQKSKFEMYQAEQAALHPRGRCSGCPLVREAVMGAFCLIAATALVIALYTLVRTGEQQMGLMPPKDSDQRKLSLSSPGINITSGSIPPSQNSSVLQQEVLQGNELQELRAEVRKVAEENAVLRGQVGNVSAENAVLRGKVDKVQKEIGELRSQNMKNQSSSSKSVTSSLLLAIIVMGLLVVLQRR